MVAVPARRRRRPNRRPARRALLDSGSDGAVARSFRRAAGNHQSDQGCKRRRPFGSSGKRRLPRSPARAGKRRAGFPDLSGGSDVTKKAPAHRPGRGGGDDMAKETIQIRLEPFDLEWLDKEVRRQGSSRGAVIRSLIRARKDTELPPVSEASCKRC